MLETVSLVLEIIYSLLLIFLIVVIIIIVLYPEYLWGATTPKKKEDLIDKDDQEIDESVDPTGDVISSQNEMEYIKYNQKFTLNEVDPRQVHRTDQIGYTEFVQMTTQKEFLEDYLEAVKVSIDHKITVYQRWLNQVRSNLGSYRSKLPATPGTHDSNLELMQHTDKVLTEILDLASSRLNKLNMKDLKNNFKQMIYNRNYGFASIVGREEVKDYLARKIVAFSRNPRTFLFNFQGIRFYGKPGIGKSKLSESVGYIFCKSYMLIRRKFGDYTAKNFTSQYVKESPRLTYKLFLDCLEAVGFIDEAPGLIPHKFSLSQDPNDEVLNEMVKFMEKPEERCLVMILAGYQDKMEQLMQSNEGLSARFPHCFILQDYTSKQLTDILIGFLKKSDDEMVIDQKDSNCMYTYIDYLIQSSPDVFEQQARAMKNLAGKIMEVINNSINTVWTAGNDKSDIKQRIQLLHSGFNEYLRSFGISIKNS